LSKQYEDGKNYLSTQNIVKLPWNFSLFYKNKNLQFNIIRGGSPSVSNAPQQKYYDTQPLYHPQPHVNYKKRKFFKFQLIYNQTWNNWLYWNYG
jgi:hypothetical protein